MPAPAAPPGALSGAPGVPPVPVPVPDYRLAFELAPVGLVLSRNRIMVDCNERVCEMFGAQREQLVGQSFRILYPSADEYERMGERLAPP